MSSSGDTAPGLLSRRGPGSISRAHVCAVSVVVLVVGAALAVAVGRDVLAPVTRTGPFGPGGLWLLAVLGLVDDTGVERLIQKIRRVEAGETDVEFSTERDGDLGRLYDAVGDLAENVTDRERERERNERYRRRLHELATEPSLDHEQTVRELLELGRERFGLATGLVTRVDAEAGRYEVETAVGTDFVEAGTVTDLEDTVCRRTVDADDVVAIYDASETGADADSGHTEWGIGAYLGAKILVDDELYGTVCFVDPEPQTEPFSPEERLFADLLGRWMSHVYERRECQRDVRESSERLGATIQASPAAIVAIDADGNVELWNPAAERIFGWSAEEVVGEPLPIVPEDESDEYEQFRERLLSGGSIERFETERLTADGALIDVTLSAAPMYDDGEVVGVVGVFEDISDRRAAERELARARSLLEQSQRLARVGAWEIEVEDDEPVGLSLTDETYRIHGLEPGTTLDLDDAIEYYHPDDRQRVSDAVMDAIREGEGYDVEVRFRRADGEQLWVRAIGDPVVKDGQTVAVHGSLQDITERVERERELERTTDLLGLTQEMADVGGWSVDLSGEPPFETEWTDRLYDIFELPQDAAPPPTMDVFEYYHPDDRDRHEAAVERAIEETGSWDQELRLVTAEGTERWVRNIGETVTEDGEVVETRGSVQDVTERREREEALRERERELQSHKEYTDDVLDAIDDVFYVIDDEGNFLRWNESLPRAGGYTDEEIAETNALEFFADADRPVVVEAMESVFAEGGSRRVEASILTKDGETVPYEFVAATVENPEGETVLAGIGRDISERKRREAALERTTELLEQAQAIAAVGGWEFDVATDTFTVTDEFRRLHGLDPEGPVTLEDVVSQYHPDEREYVGQIFEETIETAEGYDMEVRIQPDAGTTRWVRALGEPVVRDGEVVKLRGSVQDVTDEKEHEQSLRALHETAEGLLQRESASAVADLVVGTAEDILDVDGVCLYLLDEATNRLVPTANTEDFAAGGDVPAVPVGDEDNPVWNSFATSTRRVLDEGDEAAGMFPETVGGALVVPVGDHGVLAITTREPGIVARTRRLVETLVATTEAALDRLESEAAVRERDEALAEQNRRLRRQIQLTDVIRRVDQSLIEADSRDAVETAVTEELAAADDIDFAWIGTVDPGGDRVEPRTWAGSGESYLDAVSLALGDAEAEPAALAAHTGEPTVVSNVVADLRGDGWRKPALDSGFTSVLAVPIALEEYGYGVLAVYAGQPDAFGDLEQEVFAELGRTIASAINAVQTREALHADRLLELRLSFGDSETVLAQVARAADCPVEYVGTAGPSGDGTRLFFAAECDASDALSDLVTVSRFRQLSEAEGRHVYEASVTGDVLPAKLVRHGASPESIRATPTGLSVVVHLPTGTDVREFVEMLRDSYRTVELESRRTVERPTRTRQQIVGDLLADLTDRQREVLRTAYYAGFFDWPRDTTGEELADMLGVTQPTVSRHLRLGQAHVLAQLFDEEVVPAVA